MQRCKAVRWFALRRLTRVDPHRPKSVTSPARIVHARWSPWAREHACPGFLATPGLARSSRGERDRIGPACSPRERHRRGLGWEEKKRGEWPEAMAYDLGSKTKWYYSSMSMSESISASFFKRTSTSQPSL